MNNINISKADDFSVRRQESESSGVHKKCMTGVSEHRQQHRKFICEGYTLNIEQIDALAWEKMNGLLPAIVQDVNSMQILMMGYMNKAALVQTIETAKVTFYSRSKNRLWVKGETSGNDLALCSITTDCDNDTLLVLAKANGPTCHEGTPSCFDNMPVTNVQTADMNIINRLEAIILDRQQNQDEKSYVSTLLSEGLSRVAQKVGEEAVEVMIEAMKEKSTSFSEEVADLVFHLLVLMRLKGVVFADILQILKKRNALKLMRIE
ncbi:bifunctional phosphoribosyl-AMP cyclohydrolase/phosphoribosyl-ATP diphosphatase HisIE [Candidatus Berkiella cookevillensis]|uniref:Histidine biosynthesis bifunctional protein HisIE n=1 Tax=Candidatus Berkiella cookevillensis TaxID=437022 RepID=A0A0Q9YCL6_9GAMM|nr:bifunctional phosphoribosyl-AMP cyclohydrolase/phosphoribosyl-ATP diphosphatase HisIE [Candidatus Berkiella cookevillensis]MCS5708114.1 bifunctional phosphoribosyl-AMP cyclohydrolase/phosphoribosyl-ATP diphosphatase HisIE [Candidatus Berkiella cookevillensis]